MCPKWNRTHNLFWCTGRSTEWLNPLSHPARAVCPFFETDNQCFLNLTQAWIKNSLENFVFVCLLYYSSKTLCLLNTHTLKTAHGPPRAESGSPVPSACPRSSSRSRGLGTVSGLAGSTGRLRAAGASGPRRLPRAGQREGSRAAGRSRSGQHCFPSCLTLVALCSTTRLLAELFQQKKCH